MNTHKPLDLKITPQAVRAQIRRINSSDGFVRCRRMQRFLEFVVEETLAGRAEQVSEYTLAVAVFDRGQDFESSLDPIVRNDARRLRNKLLEYYSQSQDSLADHILIDIPKGAYVPQFLPAPSREDRKPEPKRHCPRLAVLPFETLSATPESTMMGRALCLSLTAKLTNLDGLETIAHSYLQQLPRRQAASELRLSHVIQGSVLKSGDRCRVIINLIHIADGTQLWAREYEVDGDEIFTSQAEIAGSVLREVTACLGLRRSQSMHLVVAA